MDPLILNAAGIRELYERAVRNFRALDDYVYDGLVDTNPNKNGGKLTDEERNTDLLKETVRVTATTDSTDGDRKKRRAIHGMKLEDEGMIKLIPYIESDVTYCFTKDIEGDQEAIRNELKERKKVCEKVVLKVRNEFMEVTNQIRQKAKLVAENQIVLPDDFK